MPANNWGSYALQMGNDGALDKAWVETRSDAGIGGWIRLDFPDTILIEYLKLDIGYDSSHDIFHANNRIKSATFRFSDGSEVEHTFADQRGLQVRPIRDSESLISSLAKASESGK